MQCVVDWFGPTDMVSIGTGYEKPDGPVEKLIGGTVKENLDKAKKASPLFLCEQGLRPLPHHARRQGPARAAEGRARCSPTR